MKKNNLSDHVSNLSPRGPVVTQPHAFEKKDCQVTFIITSFYSDSYFGFKESSYFDSFAFFSASDFHQDGSFFITTQLFCSCNS
jgi:hypothetical protein